MRDSIILWAVWIITAILLVVFIRKKNRIEAYISFLIMQVPSWLFGAMVVQGGLIEYPIGFLKMAYRASFTFEFFVFPAVSSIFNVHFPKNKPWYIKTLYTLMFPSLITIGEVYLEKYTELVKYLHWTWYYSFITILLTLLLVYWHYTQFMAGVQKKYGQGTQ